MLKRKTKYTKEYLEPIVSKHISIGAVLEEIGIRRTGGNYRMIQKWIRYWEIDTSHFKGQGWSKGESAESNSSVARVTRKISYSNEEVFVENSPVQGGTKLAKRLLSTGWEYECNECGISDWLGEPLTLHVDHINGVNNDNRLENLRFLCPNCHQQTRTWGAKNKK